MNHLLKKTAKKHTGYNNSNEKKQHTELEVENQSMN